MFVSVHGTEPASRIATMPRSDGDPMTDYPMAGYPIAANMRDCELLEELAVRGVRIFPTGDADRLSVGLPSGSVRVEVDRQSYCGRLVQLFVPWAE